MIRGQQNVRIDFETMMQARNQRNRIIKAKPSFTPKELTPINSKTLPRVKSMIHANQLDWTRQLFSKNSINDKVKPVTEKIITSPESWVDYLLALHFGVLVCARQLRHTFNLNRTFEKYVKSLWMKYLGCWKNKPLISSFTADRHGGLQLDKCSRLKRFEFFTQQELENYAENLKAVPYNERQSLRNKEYLSLVKETYYQLRNEEAQNTCRRKTKEHSKIESETLDFIKQNTVCYNDSLYTNFVLPEDVFDLKLHSKLSAIQRAMIYVQKKYSLNSLVKLRNLDPVKLLRNIKYKSGKMLNLEDRTYTICILSSIVSNQLKALDVKQDIRLPKFLSTRLKKKDQLLLLIFTLDLVANRYHSSNSGQHFIEYLKISVQDLLAQDYMKLLENTDEEQWCIELARKETKHMSIEKCLSKYLKYYWDNNKSVGKEFKQQLSDLKRSKYASHHNKLTSIEPNIILVMLTLGYYEYASKESGLGDLLPPQDIINYINSGKVEYLKFGSLFSSKVRKLVKTHCIEIKHIADMENKLLSTVGTSWYIPSMTTKTCHSLKYLLPTIPAQKFRYFAMEICVYQCRQLNLSEKFTDIVCRYLVLNWDLFTKQFYFPFHISECVYECIIKVYELVYLSGLAIEQFDNFVFPDTSKNNQTSNEGLNNSKLESKSEFDAKFNVSLFSLESKRHQSSLLWEVKSLEYFNDTEVAKVADTCTTHFCPKIREDQDQNMKEILDLFDEILEISDSEDEDAKSDDDSIGSDSD